jgi:SsrA-binding protein
MPKIVVTNKKARHDFFIEETYEAGISLLGTEVKSLRNGRANIKDSFARIVGDEIFLFNMHISPYEQGNIANHDPIRDRKLLLHKNEIGRLMGKVKEKGYTLVPLQVYFKRGYAKVEIALAKGKHLYDKRQTIAEKEAQREVERAFKAKQRGEKRGRK